MKFPYYIIATILYLCTACSSKEKEQQVSYEVGKYVYIDDNGIVHIKDKCINLRFGKDEHGHSIYGKVVVDTSDFVFNEYLRLCVACVDDRNYEHLLKISTRNKEYETKRKWIYNKLDRAGYETEPYNLYVYHISNPKTRKRLYTTACNEGWNVGTYEEFSRSLGFDPE